MKAMNIEAMNTEVEPCGLMVDSKLRFLAVLLIGENGMAEIRRPGSCSDMSSEEAILSRKVKFWNIHKKTKTLF